MAVLPDRVRPEDRVVYNLLKRNQRSAQVAGAIAIPFGVIVFLISALLLGLQIARGELSGLLELALAMTSGATITVLGLFARRVSRIALGFLTGLAAGLAAWTFPALLVCTPLGAVALFFARGWYGAIAFHRTRVLLPDQEPPIVQIVEPDIP